MRAVEQVLPAREQLPSQSVLPRLHHLQGVVCFSRPAMGTSDEVP